MGTEDKIRTNTRRSEEPSPNKKSVGKSIHSVVDGSFLTRDSFLRFVPFLLFLLVLAILYISNIYYAEQTIREIDDARKEIKELRYEFITSKSDLMSKSKRSEVAKSLQEEGITESTVPPQRIYLRKDSTYLRNDNASAAAK
jgi:hypothetical protein